MKIQKIKAWFTLIELLVVITIIGILGSWATATYTSQIQKARDATRITDVTALKSGIEQAYQDDWEYPNKWEVFWDKVSIYVPKFPKDPKTWQTTANSSFEYAYNVAVDDNTIKNQQYEVSATFENQWNIDNKAASDGWNDDYRLELWINISTLDTNINGAQSGVTSWASSPADVTNTNTCVTSWWANARDCPTNTDIEVQTNTTVLVIR